MNKLLCAGLLACSTVPAWAQTQVGVSIGINQPGVYGRIDIGNYPQPALVYAQPVIIVRQPVPPPPVYLYVPSGHQKNWRQYCGQYGACGQPVYFVQERWVRERYDEHQRHEHQDGKGNNGKGHGNGNGNGNGNKHKEKG